MSFKTVGASAINISGGILERFLAVVGASGIIGYPIIKTKFPCKTTAYSDIWDCQATFEEVI